MANWEIHGVSMGNCNCNWGCPCQFNSPTTNGFCEGILAGRIDRENFEGEPLDGTYGQWNELNMNQDGVIR